jgi:hypothetical protein
LCILSPSGKKLEKEGFDPRKERKESINKKNKNRKK